MKNKINILILIATFGLLSSCVNDSFKDPKDADCVSPGLTKTREVADIWAIAINPVPSPIIPNTPVYSADDILEAYVVSSDEGGNFYKSMYLQPLDGSKGFNLSFDDVNTYTQNFEPGRKVYLKLKGLAYGNPSSFARGLVFGAPPTDKYTVDRLLSYKEHLIPSCDKISEDVIVHRITLAQAIADDTYINTLVEISDVQFKSDCPIAYSSKDFDTSTKITSNGTTTLDVRTSRFATFAGKSVPQGRGTIRGVLSKYNSGFQIILRTDRDVKMNGPRTQVIIPPKVGNALVYSGSFSENFESYTTTSNGANLPKYINNVSFGDRFWDVKSFSSNEYIQASAFNAGGCVKTQFIVPVDFTAANNFSFKTLDGYSNGQPLKVYYSTDYIPGGSVESATLTDITSKFTFSVDHTTGYGTSFIGSGVYAIPATLTGNGYFIFEYDGTTGITTTMEIDDILVN